MDKKDVMYLVAALALVLVIALIIKPVVTGQPVNTGVRGSSSPQQVTIILSQNTSGISQVPGTIPTSVPTTIPAPTWNPNATQTVGFVDPSAYGLPSNQSVQGGTRINNSVPDTNMTTFATIASSTGRSGTTNIMYIPFPYWELVYTVEPSTVLKPESIAITPTQGQGISYSGLSGSYSSANPQFTIQVMDGDDPNRIVRTISPPGGINLDLWKGVVQTAHTNTQFKTNQKKTVVTVETTAVDPRPWTEKFFEGQRHYYFIITAQSLDSYSMDIRIPTRYIGKY